MVPPLAILSRWFNRSDGDVGEGRSTSAVAERVVERAQPPFDGAYDERLFRHFLALDRQRAERSGRCLLLVLVSLNKGAGAGERIAPAIATRMFGVLALCVREGDFTGWYRTDRVASALLFQGADAHAPDARDRIRIRVTQLLSEALPPGVVPRLQVEVLDFGVVDG